MRIRLAFLLVSVVVLPTFAAALLLGAGSRPPAPRPDHEAFQRLVGGLGQGPAIDFSRCVSEFDPRVAATCSWRHDPVPCGALFCPGHASR